jgi:hypothetical protein
MTAHNAGRERSREQRKLAGLSKTKVKDNAL